MTTLDEAFVSLGKVVTITAILVTLAVLGFARERRKVPPLVGFAVGPQMDEIVPKRFIVDPPTIENLGFRWYIEGDSNRNASVTVKFRKKGQTQWKDALPMLRVHHEISNQQFGPYRTGNLFAGSVLFLEPATTYEVRFTMRDPDGGAPAEPKIVEASTRAIPKAFDGGRTIEATPEKGLMAAYEQAQPGDIIQLRSGVYQGPFELSKSGTADKPIVFRGPADGEAALEADGVGGRSPIVTLNGTDHLYFEGLTFRNARTAVYAAKPGGSDGLVIRRCKIHDVVYGINTGCENSRNWYIADNDIVGILAYNNTSCCAGEGFHPPPIWQNGHFRNNLIMGASGYAMESGSPTAYSTMDYDAYRRNDPDRLISWKDFQGKVGRYQSLEAFFKATGLEKHGMLVDYDIFVKAGPPEQGKSYEPGDYNLRLCKGAKVIDAGTALAQVTDGFTGKAPDLGCYELGREPPHYGPRPLR